MKSKRHRAIKRAKWEQKVSDNAKYWTWKLDDSIEMTFAEFNKSWKGIYNHFK